MEFLQWCAFLILRVLSVIVAPIFWLLRRRRMRKVPAIKNPLLLVSATKLAAKIRNREVLCYDVVKSYIERIQEVNSLLNAVADERFHAALEEAKEVDRYLSTDKADVGHLAATQPLLGVPITVKESCSVKGLSYCVGSALRRGIIAAEDSKAVAKIKNAGGIILLVSNTPEYCCYWETNNRITGCTTNPYNYLMSAGGSSGGEGALLGAAASLLGLGSDVAGSIRFPALLNGVYGHKGSAKMVSLDGHFPNVSTTTGKNNLVLGALTRYAEDLPLMYKVLAESPEKLQLDDEVNMNNLNVFSMHEFNATIGHMRVSPEIKHAINKSVEHLCLSCGCTSDDFKFNLEHASEIGACICNDIGTPNLLSNPLSDKRNDWLLFELIKKLFGCSKYSLNGLYFSVLTATKCFVLPFRRMRYVRELQRIKAQFEDKLGTNGVLLCPVFPRSSFQHNEFIFMLSGIQYQAIFNNLGLPSLSVPLGIGKNGMPIGIQVVAGNKQDRLCFAVAKELEKVFGGWTPPS